jgi:hypothetical protein
MKESKKASHFRLHGSDAAAMRACIARTFGIDFERVSVKKGEERSETRSLQMQFFGCGPLHRYKSLRDSCIVSQLCVIVRVQVISSVEIEQKTVEKD